MAEMLISGVVKTLMGTLSFLLQQEFAIAWGLKKELEKLESTLTTIQTVLKDAEAKKGKNEELKNWLRKLKDAAYEADDIIDEFKLNRSSTMESCWDTEKGTQIFLAFKRTCI